MSPISQNLDILWKEVMLDKLILIQEVIQHLIFIIGWLDSIDNFVGPNNSGKSRALIDIEKSTDNPKMQRRRSNKQILIKPLSEDEAKRNWIFMLSQTRMKSMRGMLFYLG